MPGVVEVEHDRSAVPAEAAHQDGAEGISRRASLRWPLVALALALAPLPVSAVALAVAAGGE